MGESVVYTWWVTGNLFHLRLQTSSKWRFYQSALTTLSCNDCQSNILSKCHFFLVQKCVRLRTCSHDNGALSHRKCNFLKPASHGGIFGKRWVQMEKVWRLQPRWNVWKVISLRLRPTQSDPLKRQVDKQLFSKCSINGNWGKVTPWKSTVSVEMVKIQPSDNGPHGETY